MSFEITTEFLEKYAKNLDEMKPGAVFYYNSPDDIPKHMRLIDGRESDHTIPQPIRNCEGDWIQVGDKSGILTNDLPEPPKSKGTVKKFNTDDYHSMESKKWWEFWK